MTGQLSHFPVSVNAQENEQKSGAIGGKFPDKCIFPYGRQLEVKRQGGAWREKGHYIRIQAA